ncbi:DUF971 domain-containing protein [Marichromatium gracile]|uniref:1-(5-phosphoribosyl)-5-((5-phosphoribosylamino)methylideneamino)imidazole-4-carboxamide isomerase n=1 Tax=Marichromatium gracile TaxID=1048 RepID=A0ABR5VE03_MARGR|nr:DUF971 domain-containing protein [Marichromatium gracile]KXX63580.1 1-(5-phosphoribosyl)-5-((5-phosphoribosylamino)methylideneamino)imidazole-4-carboxamide isomerase [Marichromatium gracile]MCF1182773.1 DUF971 domain-containing protein [Marichromatium gracile]
MDDAHPLPTEIRLHQRSRVLELAFDDGSRFRLPCEYLRVYSPSAEVRGHSPASAKLQLGKERVNITAIEQIGAYALKIRYDDGHDSGLYDWGYLHRLGRAWQPLWQDYLKQLEEAGAHREGPDPFEQLQARGEVPAETAATARD